MAAQALAAAEEVGSDWLASEVAGLDRAGRLPVRSDGDGAAGRARRAGGTARRRGDGVEPRRTGAAGRPSDENPFGLTPRERQVLAALAEGATNREIAAALFMAEKTASVHVSRILAKLGVRSRTEAAAVAHRLALVDAG